MKLSKKVAFGGMIMGLSIVLLFLTGVFPFATMALPGIAGALLVVLVIELGKKEALAVYVGVSLLAFFVVPDREAVLYYVVFLGYYPIVKSKLEQFHSRITEFVCKTILFCVVVISGAVLLIFVFDLVQLDVTPMLLVAGFLILLVVFYIYDLAISQIIQLYLKRFRPVLKKHFFN